MGLFDRFRKQPKVDPEAMKRNFISARRQNLSYVQRTRLEPGTIANLLTGSKHTTLYQIGEMDVPGTRLLVCDPCYVGSNLANPMERTVRPGKYPVFVSVLDTPMTGRVVSAVKVTVSDAAAVRHEIAMPVGFKAWQSSDPGIFPGISIETGVACMVDEVSELPFAAFQNRYYDKHPGKDPNTDCLQPLVEETGFAMWQIPDTDYTVPVFSAGLGSGIYNAFWGFDQENRLAELVLPLVYPELFE